MTNRFIQADENFQNEFLDFVQTGREVPKDVRSVVEDIISKIRSQGDKALLEFTEHYDGFNPGSVQNLRISSDKFAIAEAESDVQVVHSLIVAAKRIETYHRHLMPAELDYVDDDGVRLGARWTPLSSVGLYVPGGSTAYPSSVLMNAIPARVAGVDWLTMVVPMHSGELNPLVLIAAKIAGVDEVITIGGAQAIAALAYGTESIKPVDKIVGPGNIYVAEAKRQVFGVVGIDLVAGPSEILVVADAENDPAWIAADLLSQAEHDENSQSILICDDADFADEVELMIVDHLSRLPRAKIAAASWDNHGAIVIVDDVNKTASLIDQVAPEHVELAIGKPARLARDIRHAGAIFLGRFSPEAIGDYVAGPSHVLPTSGSARFSSGLGILDFMKRTSIISCDANAFSTIAPDVEILANAEELHAHALSVSLRSSSKK